MSIKIFRHAVVSKIRSKELKILLRLLGVIKEMKGKDFEKSIPTLSRIT